MSALPATPIPARILRAEADAILRPNHTTRDLEQQNRILRAAKPLFARHGRALITFTNFALALRISTTTLRRHFTDLDALLGELLFRHLRAVAEAIGNVPHTTPNLHAARRAAYLAATRTPYGDPTEAHLLLRDIHTLPPDLAETVQTLREGLGDMLAFPNGQAALALLDTPGLHADQIETMLAPLAPPQPTAPLPQPAPPIPSQEPSTRRLTLLSGAAFPTITAFAHEHARRSHPTRAGP